MPRPPFQRDLFPRPARASLDADPASRRTQRVVVAPAEACARALRRRGGAMTLVLALTILASWGANRCLQPVFQAAATTVGQDLVPAVQTSAQISSTQTNASPEGLQTLAEELGTRDSVAAALSVLGPGRAAMLPLHVLRPGLLPGARRSPSPEEAALRQLQVSVLPQSRVIQLLFQAPTPALAADFLNALLASFLDRTQARQRSADLARVAWLSSQADSARSQIVQAQSALTELARRHGLADPAEQASLASQRWQQLASAESTAEIAALQQSDAVHAAAPSTPDGWDAPADLLVHRAAAAAEVSRLSAIYRPQAAPMQQAKQQLESLDASLAALRDQARQSRDRALASAELQVQDLRRHLALQAQEQAALGPVLSAWDVGQRQLRARQTIYSSLLDQFQQAAAAAGAPDLPLRIVNPAQPPARALRPTLATSLSMGFVLGCALAVAAAWLLEATDTRLHWPEAGEMGVPLLAFTASADQSVAASALAAHRNGATVFLIVAARIGAGATTIISGLVREVSQVVGSVLVLDSNPLHADSGGGPGLSELLAGTAELEQVLRRGRAPGAPDTIAPGQADAGPSLALTLAAGRGAELLDAACARYAMVLIDGGPVLEAAEASHWATLADCTLVVADARTQPRQLRRALDQLEAFGAARLGLILNRVSPPRRWIAPLFPSAPAAEGVAVLRQRAG